MPLVKWKNHNIEEVEVDLLLCALKQRYGYDFTGYARASLKRRVLALTESFQVPHLSDLLAAMLYDESVAQTIINSISVPTSEFFRDAHVWKAVRQIVLPHLDSFPRINIWQVGCGGGEETYTLAILLHEAGLLQKTRIFTSDINPAFLQATREGCWSRAHWARWCESYQSSGGQGDFMRYFVEQGDAKIAIREAYKQAIEYVQHNLVTDQVFKEMQFVVCRNVLIYFGEELQTHVLTLLTHSLERGGYLLLGRAEQILDLPQNYPDLKMLAGDVSLYRKVIRGHHV
jgi:chemotaxis protein methyltransferase CheR